MDRGAFELFERNREIAGVMQPNVLAQMNDGVAGAARTRFADFTRMDRHCFRFLTVAPRPFRPFSYVSSADPDYNRKNEKNVIISVA